MRRIGRPLPVKVYGLIEHIERTLPPEQNLGKHAATRKSLRDTKLLPKLVFRMENLYKFILLLSKKTKNDLAKHLHIGSVRDVQINSRGLREAMNRSITESHRTEVDETLLDEVEVADLDKTIVSEVDSLPEETDNVQGCSSTSSSGILTAKVTDTDANRSGARVAFRNLPLINAMAKRKRTIQPTIETIFHASH